ncbi:MAG: hypothetical protein HY823_15290 [Acidobacteria bacterium]|nr:hypothetical protein [Acidobacteriota bacterium]
MEFLVVHFPRSRVVLVDGVKNGRTEDLLELEAGTHVVSLGPPSNFTPSELTIRLRGTNPLEPREVRFEAV